MDLEYFKIVQNAYGTQSKRERDLVKTNWNLQKHWNDTYDTEPVLLNGNEIDLMIIHEGEDQVNQKTIKSLYDNKIRIGDYIDWHNQRWIIDSVDPDHKTWYMGHMRLCTIRLHWQNANGDIIERWGYSNDESKFSDGTERTTNIQTGHTVHSIYLPVDDETKVLKFDRRMVIDIDGVYPPDVYKIINRKVLITDHSYFDNGGLVYLTFEYDEFNKEVDKQIEYEGREVWVCDYKSTESDPDQDAGEAYSVIEYKSKDIRIGKSGRTYTAVFKDAEGNVLDGYVSVWEYETSIPFKSEYFAVQKNENFISFKVLDEIYAGETIVLRLSDQTGTIPATEMVLDIVGAF